MGTSRDLCLDRELPLSPQLLDNCVRILGGASWVVLLLPFSTWVELKLWLRALAPVIPRAGLRGALVPTDVDREKTGLLPVDSGTSSAFGWRRGWRTLRSGWTSPPSVCLDSELIWSFSCLAGTQGGALSAGGGTGRRVLGEPRSEPGGLPTPPLPGWGSAFPCGLSCGASAKLTGGGAAGRRGLSLARLPAASGLEEAGRAP